MLTDLFSFAFFVGVASSIDSLALNCMRILVIIRRYTVLNLRGCTHENIQFELNTCLTSTQTNS